MGRQRDSKTTGVVELGGNTSAATWNDENFSLGLQTNIHAVPRKDKGLEEEEAQRGSRPSNSKISLPFCIFPAIYNVTKEHTTPGPCPHHPLLTHAPQQQTPGHNSRDLLRKFAIRHLGVSALWRASPLLRTRLFRIHYKAKHGEESPLRLP